MLEFLLFIGSVSIVVFLSIFITLWILVSGASKSKEELELPLDKQKKADKARGVAILGASIIGAILGAVLAIISQLFLSLFIGSTDA